ncbi:MAG: NADH-quinone oxidoreductase subunit G [Gammaproteobacteria bacterium]|nr:NADH-quinone oxidoreductase subunit G [Gammaproteobacteria bacterium]MCP5417054.1 NADH-quinone oxidoreductase subunit G [Chromatiaceae bacterium]
MSDDQMVTIEVDGRELQAKAGTLLIEATDAAGINIPRFCYHKKLSVAANCRMCLVEIAKVPKPMPACATPVTAGMQVFTRSPLALAAQKGTMEFLLINHPLDCPICDQGGECELQDIALGYGNDASRFVEGKRVVQDHNIGPLIATDLTRCIHCTRCVRFGAEIAGIRELGALGRGEHMEIGTFIEKSVDSELSGNIIDICPVGSLTSKPFRYSARAWELVQHKGIAPHDSVGSNLNLHVRRNQVMRIHPRDNEALNECWISDRDRFSYEGLYSDDRLIRPLLKKNDNWLEVDWQDALEAAAQGLKKARGTSGNRLAALLSPSATLEELYLAQKLMRGLGSENIDFRLRQGDFRGQEPEYPWLGQAIAELENLNAALLIGSNIRKEQPILGHRLRKAALEGAQICFLNSLELDLNYGAMQLVNSPAGMISDLAAVAKALGASGGMIESAEVGDRHRQIAEHLSSAARAAVLLGNLAAAHPDYSLIQALASAIAEKSGAVIGYLPEAANSVGARLSGALPGTGGNNAAEMLANPHKGYLLLGVEPGLDVWNPGKAMETLAQAEFVVALSAFRSHSLEQVADAILPIASFAETSGTYVNAQGDWQSFTGAITPAGEARPAWKVLRVLGNLLNVAGFDQMSTEEVLAEVRQLAGDRKPSSNAVDRPINEPTLKASGLLRVGDVPIYAVDPLVRRAASLQKTRDAITAAAGLNPNEAERVGLSNGAKVLVKQENGSAELRILIDPAVPDGCVRIPAGLAGTEKLGGQIGNVTLEKA